MRQTVGQVSTDLQGKPAAASNYRFLILVGILIVCALVVRMYKANAPFVSSTFRSYDSAVYAQAMYLLGDPSTPEDIRRVAQTNLDKAFVMEPRVGEHLALLGYRVFGLCNWWPRLFLSLFWCLSAAAVYALGVRIHSSSAAILSVIFYLFSPCSIISSRMFHPDALMVSLMVTSLYCLWMEFHRPTRLSFALAVLTTGLAMFVKIPAAFLLLPAVAALAWNRYGFKGALMNPRVWLLVLVASLPSLWYYGKGLFVSGALQYQVGIQWQPLLYLQAKYWLGWGHMIAVVVGIPIAILGGLGLWFIRLPAARALIKGLWIGYFVYGLTFTNAISTHTYYQLLLVPIFALTLGPAVLGIFHGWKRLPGPFRVGFGIGIFAFMAGILLIAVSPPGSIAKRVLSPQFRGALEKGLNLCGADTIGFRLWRNSYDETLRTGVHIGQILHHSNRVVLLGTPMKGVLEYHGLLSVYIWYDRKRVELMQEGIVFPPVEEEFTQRFQSIDPEYFIAWPEHRLQYQPELKQYLDQRYPVLVKGDGYVIYDLRSVRKADPIP